MGTVPITNRMKNWHIYEKGTIAYAVINVPKGFRIKTSDIPNRDGEITIYAYNLEKVPYVFELR